MGGLLWRRLDAPGFALLREPRYKGVRSGRVHPSEFDHVNPQEEVLEPFWFYNIHSQF